MDEVFELGEEVGDLLVKHTPLSLTLVKQKILRFVKTYGLVRHPVLFQIIALYAGYSGKRRSAERFFDLAMDLCEDEDMFIELIINRIIYYLEIGERDEGKELLSEAKEEFPDCGKLRLLEVDIAIREQDWRKITEFIGNSRGLDRMLREMSLAGLFYKNGDVKTSMVILQSVLSSRILLLRRRGKNNFRENHEESLRLMEKVANLISPYGYEAFVTFKNRMKGRKNLLQFE